MTATTTSQTPRTTLLGSATVARAGTGDTRHHAIHAATAATAQAVITKAGVSASNTLEISTVPATNTPRIRLVTTSDCRQSRVVFHAADQMPAAASKGRSKNRNIR